MILELFFSGYSSIVAQYNVTQVQSLPFVKFWIEVIKTYFERRRRQAYV